MPGDNKKRKSIGRRTLVGIIVFTLLLTIAVSVPVSYGFSMLSKQHYNEDTQDYAGIVAHVIQGNRIAGYLETGEKDEYYYNTDAFLTALRDEVDLTDISIFVPDGDEIIYIWDTAGAEGNCDLGDRTRAFIDYMYYFEDAARSESIKSFMARTHHGEDLYLCAFSPIYNNEGKTAAFVCITRPSLEIGMIISQFIFAIFIASAIVSVIMMMIVYQLMKKRFIAPIATLTESAEEMVYNLEREQAVSVDIHTNDELQTLAEAFTKMDIDLRDYIKELSTVTAERERISGELGAAAKIQQGILPKKGMQYDDMEEFDLAASMVPAREVGGDFYDIFMADDRHLALVIADVSGKGVPAALFMVAAKIVIKYGLKMGNSPAEVFSSANEKLLENNDTGLFVTAWLALIDLDTGECTEVNAGHEHPAIRRKDSSYELIRYKHSLPLATLEDLRFSERTFKLESGDSLYVYTDGVTEATNSYSDMFGEERLIAALNKNSDASPEELLKNVKDSIDSFVGDTPQFDDITMLAFKYNGK